jgi:hypothetical protein
MADPAEILQQLYLAGFEFQAFEQFPRAVGVVRGNCVALLLPSDSGLQILGSPGWLIDGSVAVRTRVDGREVFRFKSQTVEATGERTADLKAFENDLRTHLHSKPH